MEVACFALSNSGQIIDTAGEILDVLNRGGNGRHTLLLNKPSQGDVILYEEKLRKGASSLSTVTYEFSYTRKGNEEITSVVAYDEWSDDTGGDPEVVRGGVGQNGVVIKITSKFCRGFHFKFIVYGKRH